MGKLEFHSQVVGKACVNKENHRWSFFLLVKLVVAQSCSALWEPMDCSPPGSSVHGIFQAKILEWVAISFSRGSSRPRDQTQVSYIAGRSFTIWATKKPPPFFVLKDRQSNPWAFNLLVKKNAVIHNFWIIIIPFSCNSTVHCFSNPGIEIIIKK